MGKNLRQFEEKLEKLNKEFAEFKNSIKQKAEVGGIVEISGHEWTILDRVNGGYLAITNENLGDKIFDKNSNNWKTSSLREYLNGEFLQKIEDEIGKDKLLEFERDLLSLDGQTEYGNCKDKVSLLTIDEYRKYRQLLPNQEYYWWLITSWSTKCNDYKTLQSVVCPSGNIIRNYCSSSDGVRPVCIFPSSIFKSEEE